MNKNRRRWASAAVSAIAIAFAGCATQDRRSEPVAEAEKVELYEASPAGNRNYVPVTRLWVQPWRSALSVRRYASVEAGAADLRNEAVALGGDAVINFGCYHSAANRQSDYYCNGTVIRYVR